eukprot:3847527-Rhodomonas_salina.1
MLYQHPKLCRPQVSQLWGCAQAVWSYAYGMERDDAYASTDGAYGDPMPCAVAFASSEAALGRCRGRLSHG